MYELICKKGGKKVDFIVAKFLHVTFAAIAMGGIALTLWALIPALKEVSPESAATISQGVSRRFGVMIWITISILFLTGLWMVVLVIAAGVPHALYHSILGIKIILALLIFLIALGITLPMKFLEKMRQNKRRWMVINIHLIVIVFFLGVWLGRI